MQEIDFSISINLSLTMKEGKASINIKNVDLIPAVVSLPDRLNGRAEKALPRSPKKTIHEIMLQTAKKYVLDSGQNKFTGSPGHRSGTQSPFPTALPQSKGLFYLSGKRYL